MDIWNYIKNEKIKIPNLYFSKKRKVVVRDNSILMVNDNRMPIKKDEQIQIKEVRFRTLGCYNFDSSHRK